jgi:hypothetical protein
MLELQLTAVGNDRTKQNKRECLFLPNLSGLVQYLQVRPLPYPSVKHLKGVNIRVGCNSLTGTDSLAYFSSLSVTKKVLHTMASGVKVTKLFNSSLNKKINKLESVSLRSLSRLV